MNHYRVYFIRRPDTQQIKIGISTDLPKRLYTLQAANGSPLELLGSILGGGEEEFMVHQAFADCRLLGEWFRETPRLMAFIRKLCGPLCESAARCQTDRHIAERQFDHCMDWLEEEDGHEEALRVDAELGGAT